jgi:hypothetical protein
MDATADWETFFARRAAENLLGIAVNVLEVCVDLFEARPELPGLAAALERHRGLRVIAGRAAAIGLLAAPAKARENLVWFGRVYPGSLAHWLVWFWAFGFPGNLGRLGPGWLFAQARALAAAARARRRPG